MPTQIADIVVPAEFTAYIVENSLVSTALFQSGVAQRNGMMAAQLQAGAESFTVPFWADLQDIEANLSTDNPADIAQPNKVTASKQIVRKSFVNQSWSQMDLASELSGSDALARIQDRVSSYWDRQFEKRLIASLLGVLYSNVANNASDMVNDISGAAGASANFNGNSVIDTALTLGDRLSDVKMIAMHSKVYGEALKNNEITFFKPSENELEIPTYKGMGVIVDDNLTTANAGVYITILFGPGALGYALAEPRTGVGTEIWRSPQSGNGAGQTVLFSRFDLAMHPLGMSWNDGSGANAVAAPSPSIADLANPAHWTRAVAQRKSIPLAFLVSK
jgi:hypothetical protein